MLIILTVLGFGLRLLGLENDAMLVLAAASRLNGTSYLSKDITFVERLPIMGVALVSE